ncbi:hypothetical protein ACFL5K_02825 [Gemmatimonadota bacterium]
MNEKSFEQFTEQRRNFEQALEKSLAALDRSHYPESLLECMGRVLTPPNSLRGLPLLVECLASRKVPSSLITGAEVFLRGLLLLADLELERSIRPDKSQSFNLGEKIPPAHLLLTVDTLFTWAIELAAGQADNNERSFAGVFSSFPGVDGILLGLDIAQPDLEGLLGVEPVSALAGAVLVGKELGEPAALAARWIYLRELESWFGISPGSSSAEMRDIEQRLNKMELESSSPSVVKQLALLVRFLK